MSIKTLNPVQLVALAADPVVGAIGDTYFNTVSLGLKTCTNATGPVWAAVGSGGASGTATVAIDPFMLMGA